jgi:hypothetical protein
MTVAVARASEIVTPALVRGTFCIAALGASLVLGDLLGGAPTHHGERALLAVWFWAALLVAAFGGRLAALGTRGFGVASLVLALSLGAGALLIRPHFPRDSFADRHAEIDLGHRARGLGVKRLAIDASDYGYFAIQASFGRPGATWVLDDRDPRRPRADETLTPAALAAKLSARGFEWIAMPLPRAPVAESLARCSDRNERWALCQLLR